jgi:hypothetical protein
VKYKLRTVSPERLNWLKEADVTWLYGPMLTYSEPPPNSEISSPPVKLSYTSSILDRKSILEERNCIRGDSPTEMEEDEDDMDETWMELFSTERGIAGTLHIAGDPGHPSLSTPQEST